MKIIKSLGSIEKALKETNDSLGKCKFFLIKLYNKFD